MSRAYNYNQKTSATRRIKKEQRKAKWVGFLYFIGTIAVSLLALLGCLNIKFAQNEGGAILSLFNFFKLFFLGLQGAYESAFVFFPFLVMAFIVIVNFFKAFDKFRKVLKKNDKNIGACNRNVSAMEDCGELFASNFAVVLISYLLMYVFSAPKMVGDVCIYALRNENPLTMMGMIMLIVGFVVHFLAGAIGASSSIFIVSVSVQEKRREDSVMLFIVRSFIKVAGLIAFAVLFAPLVTINECLPTAENGFDPLFNNIIVFAVELIALIILCIYTKKATERLEFNLFGMDAYGIRRCSAFALVFAILSAAVFVVRLFIMGETMEQTPGLIGYILSAVIGIAVFILEYVIQPREHQALEEKLPGLEEKAQEKGKKNKKNDKTQAIEEAEQENAKEKLPLHAARYSSVPSTIDLRLVVPEEENALKKPEEMPIKWQVVCPTCGKTLAVKDTAYSRCPACGKVFKVNVGKIAPAGTVAIAEDEPLKEEDYPIKKKRGKKEKPLKEKPIKEKKAKKVKPKKVKKGKSVAEQIAAIEEL